MAEQALVLVRLGSEGIATEPVHVAGEYHDADDDLRSGQSVHDGAGDMASKETYDGLDGGVMSKLRLPQSRLGRLSWFGHDSSLAGVILGPQHVSVAAAGEMQR